MGDFGFWIVHAEKIQNLKSEIENRKGVIAQLVEHLLCKQGVAGSNPANSTTAQRRGFSRIENAGAVVL